MEYKLLMEWKYIVSSDRMAQVKLYERVTKDPTGEFLKHYIDVTHDGILIKSVQIEKFHTAMFAFHKTIDLEVEHYVTSI